MGGFGISGGLSGSLGAAAGPISAAISIAKSLGINLGSRNDPALAHHFSVEIDGLIVGGFTEISGLTAEFHPVSIAEGGQNGFVEQRAAGVTYPNLVLKRGITADDGLWQWYSDVISGNITRHNGSIVLMTADILEMWRWNFQDAYPIKWVGPSFHADQSQVAVESIELVHRGITKDLAILGPAAISGAISGNLSVGSIGL